MAGKGIGEILKIVEFLKNGLAGVCLFLVAYNLLQLFQGKGSRREIIHACLWAGLASVIVIRTFIKSIRLSNSDAETAKSNRIFANSVR